MSIQFNVSLCPWPKYTKEERQLVPKLILMFYKEAFVKNTPHTQQEAHKLTILYQVILLQNAYSVQCVFVSMN
jgi:hypothetical protein